MKYTADFETTTDPNDCRVWACGICSIEDYTYEYGNSMEWFMDYISMHIGDTFYFHNLKFDGEFIISWLLDNGYKHISDRRLDEENTFTTLISNKGQFYSMEICFGKKKTVKIIDSLKILPFSVEQVAHAFGLPISKLSIDYTAKREVGHILTNEEIEYLKNDVLIMAMSLHELFSEGLHEMTQGSNALKDYKNIVGSKNFEKWYPLPDYDYEVRQSYKGGWTYCDPRTQGKDVGKGIVLDVNSLYPSVMYYEKLPYGTGIGFTGRYVKDETYDLYVQSFKCQFELKENHVPTLQIKEPYYGFRPTEYLNSSDDKEVTLCMTSVDLKLFFEHYHVYNITWIGGYKFKSTTGLFKDYIDKWMKVKIESTQNGNKGMRTLAKLMLNALYGKFALNPKVQSKIPYKDELGRVRYADDVEEMRDPIYIPMGTFITAYARYKTITSAQKCYDRFMYADTDSLHLLGTEIPEGLEIHPTKLGAWDLEATFTRARFLRQKTYIEEIDGELHITCAGMPKKCYTHVTWDNFQVGQSFKGKLQLQHVKGGIVLKDIDFTIKA